MSTFNKLYERTITRLLTDRTTKAIPPDLDLWPAIHQRLAEREQLIETLDEQIPVALPSSRPLPSTNTPASRNKSSGRLFRYGGALAGLAALLTFGVVFAFAILPLTQRPQTTTIVAPQIPMLTPEATAQSAGDSTLIFSVPVSKEGIRYIETTATRYSPSISMLSPLVAAAPDGTFWFADGRSRLLHYSAAGKRLGSIPLPADKGEPRDMAVYGDDFWLLYVVPTDPPGYYPLEPTPTPVEPAAVSMLYRLGPDGRELARYPLPDYLRGLVTGFILGEHGEVLLKGFFTNVITDPSHVPEPVPTEEMPQTPPKPYWQVVDAKGNPTSEALEGYMRGGRLYSTQFGYQTSHYGYIKAGDTEIIITARDVLQTLDLLQVKADGSFYVLVADDTGTGNPYIIVETTVRHYSANGKLLELASVPTLSVKLLTGHNGDFYSLVEQPVWDQREGKGPSSVEVRRLTFYPADQPLPTLPPSTSTPVPLPTTTLPPAPIDTTQISTEDLKELKAKSDVVAQVIIHGRNDLPSGHVISVEVQRWLWQASSMDTKTLTILIPEELWAKMPENFRDDPKTQDRKGHSVYILFLLPRPLINGECPPGFDDCTSAYSLTDGLAGSYMVNEGYIRDAAILKYNGWPVQAFSDAITNIILTTPTAAVPTQDIPTRVPGKEPISAMREGEGFRLDVHEGLVNFGSGPWISNSRLIVNWVLSSDPDQHESRAYLFNVEENKLESLPWSPRDSYANVQTEGKLAVLHESAPNAMSVNLLDIETGKKETVYDHNPTAPQWAGADAHTWDLGSPPTYIGVETTWVGPGAFLLTLTPQTGTGVRSSDRAIKLLLADVTRHEVRLLAARGTFAQSFPNGVLLWQSGWVDGPLHILSPPYTGQPTTITPDKDLWIRDWTATSDGQRVAWIEAKAPPGDWSHQLPATCVGCVGQIGKDPEPEIQAIAIWDSATGQISRYPMKDPVWSFSDTTFLERWGLRWRNDGSSLLYATHVRDKSGAENAGHTALHELSLNGRSTLLATHKWYGRLEILWEGNDKSVYYYVRGKENEATGEIMRLHPDGKSEALHTNIGWLAWQLDGQGHLLIPSLDKVTITDLNTGDIRQATFTYGVPHNEEHGWAPIALSLDGKWASVTGSNSNVVKTPPDGRPTDPGYILYIMLVK